MLKNTLYDSPKYRTFIQDRNKALEQLNLNAQIDISNSLDDALEAITGFVSYLGINDRMTIEQMAFVTSQLDARIQAIFTSLRSSIVQRMIKMRKTTFVLTYLSELEAIARATQKTKVLDPRNFQQKLQAQMTQDTLTGNSLEKQTWFTLSKLKDKIIQAFQRGIVMEETPRDVVSRVKAAYPNKVSYKRPPRALKPIREADSKKGKEFEFYNDLVTDSEWDEIVNQYSKDLPDRSVSSTLYTGEDGIEKYDWEIEQEVTDDFVQQVRQGQLAGGNALGINDFVWVAVIDKKTCEVCCLPRAGKTTSEIKAMLSSGELDKDQCDAVVPPAHPWCRCDIAPIGSDEPVEGPDWKSFDNWLNS